ncbi:MAG: hypothetical protein HON90_00225, partial [Halobacteriovoraceae bacterium]|nr:hypothetical protein [Halobacteriovoraceae bacterium]
MKKQVLKKKITEIAKALTTQRSKDALAILSEELKNYTEPRSIAVVGDPNKLVVSDEVAQKTNALALYTDGACRGNPGP